MVSVFPTFHNGTLFLLCFLIDTFSIYVVCVINYCYYFVNINWKSSIEHEYRNEDKNMNENYWKDGVDATL